MRPVVVILIATLRVAVDALYDSSDDVVDLTANNFRRLVVESDDIWLVEFYAPWCGHCQSLAPEWKKAATALKGIVKVGAVNMDMHASVGGPYGIQGFPTIKMFGLNKNSPQDYMEPHKKNDNQNKNSQGARTAQGLTDAAMNLLRSVIQGRLSGRGGSSGRQSGGGGGGGGGGNANDVIELTDTNFEKEVFGSKDLWLVEFFAPWCGHCKALAPEWAKAATELKGKVKVGALDATVHTVMANRFGIRGYPTIKVFPAGAKDFTSAENYDGARTADGIVAYALDKVAESIEPPEIQELTSNEVLKENCEKHPLCVVSILPHILDSQSEGRNNYIKILKELGEKYKKKMWGWVWAEGGAHPKLEETLGIGGFGYPAMAVVNVRKKMYVLLKGSFSSDGINDLLRAVSVGRGSTEPIKGDGLPAIEERPPWDGKDAEPPQEEDLGDFSWDDEEKKNEKKDEL